MKSELAKSVRTTPCDLCNSDQFEIVGRRDRRGQPLTTVICSTCGLVSHEKIPSDEELENYYAREYRQDYHGEYTPSPHRVMRAVQVGKLLLSDLQSDLKPDDRVFEIGAGIGCTVAAFRDAGFEASGIEPGQGFCSYAINELHLDVQQRSLADIPSQPSFDFALLVHVIEHLNSPRTAINQIRSILREGGRLYVECPDLAQTHAAPSKLFHYAHIYNFVPSALQSLCESCGFQLVRSIPSSAKVIKHVYEVSDKRNLRINRDTYETALAGIFRYNAMTYHLRPRYIADRARRVKEMVETRLFSNQKLQQHKQSRRAA